MEKYEINYKKLKSKWRPLIIRILATLLKHDPNSYTTQQEKGNQHKDTKAPSAKTQNRSHHSATGQNKQDIESQNTSYH